MTAKLPKPKFEWKTEVQVGPLDPSFEGEYQLQARGSGKTTQLESEIVKNYIRGLKPTFMAMDDHLATVTTDPKDMMMFADPSGNKENFVVMTDNHGQVQQINKFQNLTINEIRAMQGLPALTLAQEQAMGIIGAGNTVPFLNMTKIRALAQREQDFQKYLAETKHAGFLSARSSVLLDGAGNHFSMDYFCQHCLYKHDCSHEQCRSCFAWEHWTPYTGLCDKCMNHKPDHESCGFCQECLRGEDADAH
jgi:hypothetical protein